MTSLLDIGVDPSGDEGLLMWVSASGSIVMESTADASPFVCRRIALPPADTQTDILLGTVNNGSIFARLVEPPAASGKNSGNPDIVTSSAPERSQVVGEGSTPSDSETSDGPGAGTLVSMRSALAQVSGLDTELLMRAAALADYHSTHQFCPACGSATRAVNWGRSRQCEACGTQHFPRTDPAVIVAILDDADRLLLGHHIGWEATRRSIFAGFVEAGESVEQAIHREIAEEVGLEVCDLVYAGSQPWPMPRSLMLGFWARSSGTVCVDGEEITSATWYTRESLLEAVAAGEVTLPPKASIASRLVQRWLDSQLVS